MSNSSADDEYSSTNEETNYYSPISTDTEVNNLQKEFNNNNFFNDRENNQHGSYIYTAPNLTTVMEPTFFRFHRNSPIRSRNSPPDERPNNMSSNNLRQINFLPMPNINFQQDNINNALRNSKSERQKKRRSEKLRIEDFFDTLKEDIYEAKDLTNLYNRFFRLDDEEKISPNGLGHLNEIKEKFKRKHKYYNTFQKVTLYAKKKS